MPLRLNYSHLPHSESTFTITLSQLLNSDSHLSSIEICESNFRCRCALLPTFNVQEELFRTQLAKLGAQQIQISFT